MRLLTHNLLTSHVPGVKNGYPLRLQVTTEEVEFNPDFIVRMLPRLHWDTLVHTLQSLGQAEGFPEAVPDHPEENEDFLRKAHHALLEIRIQEGSLQCPESEKTFPITQGVPNMLLTEEDQ